MAGKMRYSDVDELMNQFGTVLPENTTITDMIRRENNVVARQDQVHPSDETRGH